MFSFESDGGREGEREAETLLTYFTYGPFVQRVLTDRSDQIVFSSLSLFVCIRRDLARL